MVLRRYFVGCVSFILSYIIPKKKDLYIFGSINGKSFSGNSKTMYLYFFNLNKKLELYYMTRNKELFTKGIPNLQYINTLKSFFLFLRAEYIFTDCDLYDVNPGLSYQPGRFNVINLWHGDPIKAIGYLSKAQFSKGKEGISKKIFKNYFNNVVTLGCASSDFFKNILNKGHLTSKYSTTGLARNDVFFEKKLEFFNVQDILKLYSYKNVILYVPTWRQDSKSLSPFSRKFLEDLNKWLKIENSIFVIKMHQNSDPILKKSYSNIIDVSKENFDIQEIMKYSDVMITDYSSIFIDYMLLNRPIFFYAYDYKHYKKNLVNLIDKYENCVIDEGICYDESSLFELLKKRINLVDSSKYRTSFFKLKNKYHKYQDGGYCKNILDFITK